VGKLPRSKRELLKIEARQPSHVLMMFDAQPQREMPSVFSLQNSNDYHSRGHINFVGNTIQLQVALTSVLARGRQI
jgi:hypothetical protein